MGGAIFFITILVLFGHWSIGVRAMVRAKGLRLRLELRFGVRAMVRVIGLRLRLELGFGVGARVRVMSLV
jgi:hypothetical protein